MQKRIFIGSAILGMGTIAFLISSPAETQTAGSFVALQPSLQTPQNGNIYIDHSIRAKNGSFYETGSNTSVYAENAPGIGNGVYARNFTAYYPGLVSFVQEATNASVWARN